MGSLRAFQAHSAGGIALGIQIHQQDLGTCEGKVGGQVDGGGGFADPAFLAGDGDDSGHSL